MPESSRRTDESLSAALQRARDVLAREPAGLLTDFDGTLSPIVADPALARLVDGASGALADLSRRLAVVAIVTGRAPLEARRLTEVPGLLVVGNHGIEWLDPDAAEPIVSDRAATVRQALAAAVGQLPRIHGVFVEEKGISATVHYRGAAEPEVARARILDALGEVGQGIRLHHGRMSIELRPDGLGDKGTATRTIIERFGLRGAIVMGDDVTDLDMFDAVAAWRAAGHGRALIVGVGGADREIPPRVAEAADVMLAHPEEAATFLATLAKG